MNVRSIAKGCWEVISVLAFCAVVVFLVWAYCLITPDQLSGEADLHFQECEDAGVEYAPAYSGEVR